MKIAVILNLIIVAYLALISLLGIESKIVYGYGLGDIVYVFASGVLDHTDHCFISYLQ